MFHFSSLCNIAQNIFLTEKCGLACFFGLTFEINLKTKFIYPKVAMMAMMIRRYFIFYFKETGVRMHNKGL